jgi:hypothetical protein
MLPEALMRRYALRRYLVFRVKLIEFLDMAGLWKLLGADELRPVNPAGRQPKDFADSLRTALLSWFALFIDKNGTDVIELWKELFPTRKAQIEEAWERMKPAWNTLRTFRNKAGFHADSPPAFFNARREILKNQSVIMRALAEFQKLQGAILNAESAELANFPASVDAFLDELEEKGGSYNRSEFKRYLMIH